MSIKFTEIIDIFTLNEEEFFGMSSDDVELFALGKYDVSASKRTIVRISDYFHPSPHCKYV